MKTYVVDKKGRIKLRNISRDKVIVGAFNELLKSHDNLYCMAFQGTVAKPSWDISAKNARRICKALQKGEPLPTLTIESDYL